jgi:ion channel-forming bestrophin family protein
MPVFEKSLTEMTTIQGGCERIDNTPVPFAYTTLIHRIVGFYALLLPFGIVNDVQWMTPLVVFMICHAFFGLDEIGDEIEEPFGIEPQDLPLAAISRTIEINLLQYLDEPDVPPMLEPVGRVLQ